MNTETTKWPPTDFPNDIKVAPSFGSFKDDVEMDYRDDDGTILNQPGFEFAICWNRPHAKWWQPYVVVTIWKRKITAGWLYE